MQPAVQAGGPPVCPLNGHDSSSKQQQQQAHKPEAEHPAYSVSVAKSKKRERSNSNHHHHHHSTESSAKLDDSGESKRLRRERTSNSSSNSNGIILPKIEDSASILDKNGGLVSVVGVDRLYHLMQHSESSMKLLGRTSLAGAVAATEKEDCLGRFVQLGGLNLFNDWLQEVHRGKLGDVSSCKDPDKAAEDLLLTILRALERLPVDLEILKSCHAGRSVKNLRAHKNPEIQKKAKKLVDAWKRKVVGAQELRPPADLSKTLCWPHGGGGAVGGGGARSSMSHGASAKPKGATGSNSTAISNSNSNTGSDVLGKSVPAISGSCPPSPTATFRDNNHPPSSQMQSGGTGPAPDPAYPSASAAPSVPDEKSSNVWSNGSGKSSATAMNPPFSKSVSLRSSGPAKGAAAAGVNGTVKDFGSLKPHGWAGSRGVTAAAASASSEKVIASAVSEKTSTNPNPQIESVKMEASSNQRIIVRLPNPGKGPLISPSEGGGGGPSATNSRGSPSRRNSSSPPAHESLEGKSWSPSVSRVEDGRPSSVSAKQGVTAGHDASDAGGDLEGAYRPSEPECQSSESQLSLSSSQPKSVDNGGLEAPKKQQQKMERAIVMANAAEDTGISLLACIAADESLKSEKDASTKNRNYSKDVAEISEKENGSADTAKLKRGSFGSMQSHAVDESGEFAKTEAVSAVGVTKLEDDAMESAKSDSPQKELSSSSPGNIRAEHGLEEWAGDPSGGHGRSTSADKNDDELGTDSGTEPVFKFPEEDALELAVQVAKEVEQEMETYEKNTPTTAEAKDTTDAAKDSAATVSFDTKPEDEKTDQAKQTQIGDSELGNSGLERSDPTAEQIHTSPSSATAPSEVSTPVNSIQNSRAATPERAAENNATCTEPEAPDRGGHCFDLNEGVMLDENNPAESNGVCYPVTRIPVIPIASHPMAVAVPPSLSTPIAVVASVKGAFVTVPSPPKDRCEPGWRGTAATSAFRPAEPRRATPEKVAAQPSDAAEQRNADKNLDRVTEDVAGRQASEEGGKDALPDSCSAKAPQPPLLDFDLNVADESLLQEEGAAVPNPVNESVNAITQSNACSSVKFDLDLNRADETEENATGLPSSDHMFKSESKPIGSSSEPKPKHNFDLNDGPSMEDPCPGDDSTAFQGSSLRHGGPQECAAVSFKMPAEMASMANWSQTAGGPMSAMAMSAFPSVRPENTFPVAVPQTFFSMGQAISPFHSDVYRPPHGFSAPTAAGAAPFSYPAQSPVFPYTGYPFGFSSASFPAATGSFLDATGSHPFNPAVSQMLTSATMLPPHLRPPYVVGLTKIPAPTNSDRPWSRHGLDLNAGPDAMDVDNRDDRTSSRFMAALEGPWLADRHSSVTSESLKRKEPEGGWEFNTRFGLKQESRR